MGDIPYITTLCLNGTLPHGRYAYMYVRKHIAAIYNLTTLCLNGTLPCVDFMDVIMGDIP